MTRSESTSAQIAAIAARGIKSPASLKLFEIQAVCASALTQVEAEAAGPKPVKAWGFEKDGILSWVTGATKQDCRFKAAKYGKRIVRVLITAIPPTPRKSVSGKHIVVRAKRKGK